MPAIISPSVSISQGRWWTNPHFNPFTRKYLDMVENLEKGQLSFYTGNTLLLAELHEYAHHNFLPGGAKVKCGTSTHYKNRGYVEVKLPQETVRGMERLDIIAFYLNILAMVIEGGFLPQEAMAASVGVLLKRESTHTKSNMTREDILESETLREILAPFRSALLTPAARHVGAYLGAAEKAKNKPKRYVFDEEGEIIEPESGFVERQQNRTSLDDLLGRS